MASFWEVQRVETIPGVLDDMITYTSQPNVPGKHPAVIVIMEAFGINKHIQNVCDRLMAEGYFAVAPALFHREDTNEEFRGSNPIFGYGTEDADARSKAMGNLTDDQIILDVNVTISWLQSHTQVQGDKIGIVGFCVGGRITYLAAAACPGLSAASVYYGGNLWKPFGGGLTPFDRTRGIACPVLGNFGELDQNPTVDEVHKLEAELQKFGKTHDFKIYPGAGHGFNCEERDSYHEASAKDAWDRTLAWFQKHLAAVPATA